MSSLWQEVQNPIPHISFEDNFFRKYFRYAWMTSLKNSMSDISATISNINAQFAPVNRGINSASIRVQQLFRKYFRYAQMTSLKFLKFNFTAAVDNIHAQLTAVNRGLNSAYIMLQKLLQVLPVCANDVIESFKV